MNAVSKITKPSPSVELKALNKTSVTIGNATKKMDKYIQDHLIDIARWINGNGSGNVTPASFFVKQLSEGTRKNAIRQWFLDFAGCTWNAEKEQFGRNTEFKYDDSVANAAENAWYVYTPEAKFVPINGERLLHALIAKLKKGLEDTEHSKEHNINKAMLRELEAVEEKFKAAPKVEAKEVKANTPKAKAA